MNTQKSLCFVAGRSGGHLIPSLTLAQNMQKNADVGRIIFITTNTALDKSIMQQAPCDYTHYAFNLPNIPKNPLKFIIFLFKFFFACWRSFWILHRARPACVISIGGYISLPVVLMARLKRIPVDLYELNAFPGKATSFLARFAQHIYVCFASAAKFFPEKKCIIIDYPIRFTKEDRQQSLDSARQALQLSNIKRTIFILGGSQGSQFLNGLIKQWIELNTHIHALIQIIHQTGTAQQKEWQAFYATQEIPAIVFDYRHDLNTLYQASDIIISRAGAGSLFESAFFQKPSIIIPLQTNTTDHQKDNARAIAAQMPNLFTIIYEHEIKKDNMKFFSIINRRIHESAVIKPARELIL